MRLSHIFLRKKTDIVKKFEKHAFMIKIKKNHQGHFSFAAVYLRDVNKEIDWLQPSKAIQ